MVFSHWVSTVLERASVLALSASLFFSLLLLSIQSEASSNSDALPRLTVDLQPPLMGQLNKQWSDTSRSLLNYSPVVIKGYQLKSVAELPSVKRTLLVTWTPAGDLQWIPSQIDQYDESGLIYLEGVSKNPIDGSIEFIDDYDELAFMFKDISKTDLQQVPPAILNQWKINPILNIELVTFEGEKRYALLVSASDDVVKKLQSQKMLVNVDLKRGDVQSDHYQFSFNPRNLADVKSVALQSSAQGSASKKIELFDHYKLRISTGVMNKGLRVAFESGKNIFVVPKGVVSGPVRSTVLYDIKLTWFLFTVYRNPGMIRFYENNINVPSRFARRQLRALNLFVKLLKQPRIELLLASKGMKGAEYSYANNFNEHFQFNIDGTMSKAEQAFNKSLMFGQLVQIDQQGAWRTLLANHLPLVPGGLFERYLGSMKAYNVFQDQPDEFITGTRIEGLPRPLVKIMGAFAKMEFNDVNNIGDLIDQVLLPENAEYVDELNRVNAEIIAEIKQERGTFLLSDYVSAFLKDFEYFKFGGVDHQAMIGLVREALMECESLERCQLADVLKNMKGVADRRGVDLRRVRHIYLDNSIWFMVG